MARADIGRAAEETVREILFVTGPRPGEVRAGNQKQKRGDGNTPTQSIRSATGLSAGHPRAVRAAAARGTRQGRPPGSVRTSPVPSRDAAHWTFGRISGRTPRKGPKRAPGRPESCGRSPAAPRRPSRPRSHRPGLRRARPRPEWATAGQAEPGSTPPRGVRPPQPRPGLQPGPPTSRTADQQKQGRGRASTASSYPLQLRPAPRRHGPDPASAWHQFRALRASRSKPTNGFTHLRFPPGRGVLPRAVQAPQDPFGQHPRRARELTPRGIRGLGRDLEQLRRQTS